MSEHKHPRKPYQMPSKQIVRSTCEQKDQRKMVSERYLTHCNNNNFRLRFIAGFVPNVFGSFFSRDVQDQKWFYNKQQGLLYTCRLRQNMTQKTGDNKKKGDSKVKVDRQGGKGVKESAKRDETIEGWWWRSFVHTGQKGISETIGTANR